MAHRRNHQGKEKLSVTLHTLCGFVVIGYGSTPRKAQRDAENKQHAHERRCPGCRRT